MSDSMLCKNKKSKNTINFYRTSFNLKYDGFTGEQNAASAINVLLNETEFYRKSTDNLSLTLK